MLEFGISDHRSFITPALKSQLVKGNAKKNYVVIIMNLVWIILKQS